MAALIDEVGTGKRWKADALARALAVDDATRTRLKTKTIGAIDCTKAHAWHGDGARAEHRTGPDAPGPVRSRVRNLPSA